MWEPEDNNMERSGCWEMLSLVQEYSLAGNPFALRSLIEGVYTSVNEVWASN